MYRLFRFIQNKNNDIYQNFAIRYCLKTRSIRNEKFYKYIC